MSEFKGKPSLTMAQLLKSLLILVLLTAFTAPAWSQGPMPLPVAPGVAPAWVVVPTSPKVLYAPNAAGDVFRLHKKYYYYYGGYWYQSKHLRGPWHPVRKVPKAIRMVSPSCFKSPPPW